MLETIESKYRRINKTGPSCSTLTLTPTDEPQKSQVRVLVSSPKRHFILYIQSLCQCLRYRLHFYESIFENLLWGGEYRCGSLMSNGT